MLDHPSSSDVKKTYRVASDVGGTFSDVVTVHTDEAGEQHVQYVKAHTTPPNFGEGVLRALAESGVPLASIEQMVHGSTVVINAITERKGIKTGLITTTGFRDILEIARGDRPDFFNLEYVKPAPFVPRYLRREIPGRVSYQGVEDEPVDLSHVEMIVRDFQADGVGAIAVCLINAYTNPVHEIAVLTVLRTLCPEITVIASHEITREWREYERMNTTVLSAYIKPIAKDYLQGFETDLRARGFTGTLDIMQSNGGIDSVERVAASPITMVESGPAGGVWGAAALAELLGIKNSIALDIGGTTAKCALIAEGRVPLSTDYMIERTAVSPGYPIMVPVVDITEIGNGGGSIAWFDPQDKLHVGPRSAGAVPGPVAYGRGGDSLTTTDALLVLGHISAEQFCGGTIAAEMTRVDSVLQSMADHVKITPKKLAGDIIRVANHNMQQSLQLISVNRGHDPRDFSLFAFGGGGGLHACELARDMGVKEVVIPHAAAVFAAWGMLLCDLRRDFLRTQLIDLQRAESALPLIQHSLHEMRAEASLHFTHHADLRVEHYGRLRYHNQSNYVEVRLPDELTAADAVHDILARFHDIYEQTYTYRLPDPVEMIGFHSVAWIAGKRLSLAEKLLVEDLSATSAISSYRAVDYLEAGVQHTAIYDAERLLPGMALRGPAVIQSAWTTIVVLPGLLAHVDSYSNVRIHMQCKGLLLTSPTLTEDPVTDDIIQRSLQSAAEEMFTAMRRTAMSPIIYEVLDMGTAVMDAEGNLTSSGAGIPIFIAMLSNSVRHILRAYPVGTLSPGDVIIVNDPYCGGVTHLNDVVLAMPVFSPESELIAWTVNIAHWPDIGGICPGGITADARSLSDEGYIISPLRIIASGKPNDDLITTLASASRMSDVMKGDLWAGIASVRVGEKRIQQLLVKYGASAVKTAITRYFDYANEQTLAGLRALPAGVYKKAEVQDDDEVLRVTITITADRFIVDLRENPDQHAGPVNMSRDATEVTAGLFFKALTAPSSVCNAGSFRALQILTRHGSVFDPIAPAPMGFYYEIEIRLLDLLWRALAETMAIRLPAGGFASICGTLFGGTHPVNGRGYTVVEAELGGWGASSDRDGNSAVFSAIHGHTYNCPAEVSEARNGVRVNRYSFHAASGGHGQFRGGRGVCIEYEMRSKDGWLTAGYTRFREKPWPLAGGCEGTANYIEVVRKAGDYVERYATTSGLALNEGDVIRIVTGHGAGYGDPALRDIDAVVRDLRDEIITMDDARDVYQLEARAPDVFAAARLRR